MPPENRSRFINVDELLPHVSLEQVAAYYGVELPEIRRIGAETRMRCFLNCGRTCETGDRALAVQADHPAKQWKCHQYSCGKGGNLVSLCDLLKPGDSAGGRPRGDRFKQIAADLQAMVAGILVRAEPVAAPQHAPAPPPKTNLPLAESHNERARSLVNLDAKFVTDPSQMPPAASAYFRRRPFLSPEECKKWRVGYLPRDAGGEDKTGGTMRGKIVYGYAAQDGQILTWFGRDPEFEEKHRRWEAAGKVDREPEKFHFVKGFYRGLELYGQHALREPGATDKLQAYGLVVVEGPNDVTALSVLGVTAVGLCSNTITEEQAKRVARLASELARGIVTLMLDCDEEGHNGVQQALPLIAERVCVRLGWSQKIHGGRFRGRQPESVTQEEWQEISEVMGKR